MKLEDHPTVQRIHLKTVPSVPSKKESLDAGWLKQLVLDAGADDVGFVEIGRPALDGQREDIFKAFPHTKTLISFVVRLNREAIRTPARSVSNTEFHHSGDEVNDIARSVVQTLEDRGIRAMNPAMGFRMEILTSRPATPITTGSSWAASPIGSSRWPTARTPATTAVESAMQSRPRCGRASPSGRTTNRRTVRRSARPEKTLLGRSSLIGRHISRTSCGRFKRRKRRFTSPRIPTPRRLSPNGFPAKKSNAWATA